MKLAVFCISGLCTNILPQIRLSVLDKIAYHDIATTIPSTPITAWTSAWTGVGPAIHGKFAGSRGKKPKLETVWDIAERQGKSVVLHEEGDWSAFDTTGDVHVYRLDSMADKLQGEDMAGAQEVLNGMADIIERATVPYLIVSAFGVNQHVLSLNVDRMLLARNLMTMTDRGHVYYEKSYAYPADLTGKKPRNTYGIFVNHSARAHGFLELSEALSIETDLLVQLNQVDDIEALSAHQVYDIGGAFYESLPDIVFRGNGRVSFRTTGETDLDVLSPYGKYGPAPVGMIASNQESLIQGIHSVTDVKTAILRGLRQ